MIFTELLWTRGRRLVLVLAITLTMFTHTLTAYAQDTYCDPYPSYAVAGHPHLWCTPGWERWAAMKQIFISVPGEYQWSDRDGFGAYMKHDMTLLRPQYFRWLQQGVFDYMQENGIFVENEPGPVQPEVYFDTFYYNIFEGIDSLADKFCALARSKAEQSNGNASVHITSVGFGAKVVAHAIFRGCIQNIGAFKVEHLALYPELPNFAQLPPNYRPPPTQDYAFGKFDVYRHFEANSALNTEVESVFDRPLQFTAPFFNFTQYIESPETYRPPTANARNYAFKYRDDGTLEPTNIDFRLELAIFQTHMSTLSCYKLRARPDGSCGPIDTPDCQADPESCLRRYFQRPTTFTDFKLAYAAGPVRDAFDAYMPSYRREGFGGELARVQRCGDGHKDSPQEECDPPDNKKCNLSCKLIVCGDSKLEGDEECDPPAADLCSPTCKLIEKCGNQRKDPGEQCDPPAQSSKECMNMPHPDPAFEATGKCKDDCACEWRRKED